LLEGNPIYGTPDHQRVILNMMNRVMSQAAAFDGGRSN
jgi:hypothetical protein